MNKIIIMLVAMITIVTPRATAACTAFALTGKSHFVAKNFDYHSGMGYILVNQRTIRKTAMGVNHPAQWVSKYGSITFNQYGREFPQSGMNEAGLVIEALWLNETKTAEPSPTRVSIDLSQWAQFQLDNAATIGEVIVSLDTMQITPLSPIPLHYFIADSSGQCIIVECTEGITHYHQPDSDTRKLITNSSYEASYMYAADIYTRTPATGSSLLRYQKTSYSLKKQCSAATADVNDMFRILRISRQGNMTRWSIVYDQDQRIIYFTTRPSRAVHTIRFTSLDFSCSDTMRYADIKTVQPHDTTVHFIPFHVEDNKALLNKTFATTSALQQLPPGIIEDICSYLQGLQCATPAPSVK